MQGLFWICLITGVLSSAMLESMHVSYISRDLRKAWRILTPDS
jgi:hypothetical protein